MYDLGPENERRSYPALIDLDDHHYFLVHDESGYRLLSSVCPHQGGLVVADETHFECPNHGWRFDLRTGQCLTAPSARLSSIPVSVRNGRLVADIPRPTQVQAASSRQIVDWPSDFHLRLVGHASLEIQRAGFTLLTDPWIKGPAFLGSWVTYPPSQIDPSTIRPDAIWISHEHSDHFHKPTLRAFPLTTPIYFPDFPNGRLQRELAGMGFVNIHPMQFGRAYDLGSGFRITCFEPSGLWNDSIVLIEIGEIRLLNINDAGINHRIASIVGPVDILSSAYSPASSYPFAWSHLADDAKAQIIERARVGLLGMLHNAVTRYRARYLLPFASHFALWHPSHRRYEAELRRNTLDDVKRAFDGSTAKVIDILPGGSWHPASGVIDHGPDRTHLYDRDRIRTWLDETFDQTVFDQHHPPHGPFGADDLDAYFERLNSVPDIAFCEDIVATVEGMDGDAVVVERSFEIVAGKLSVLPRRADAPNVTIRMPVNILRYVVLTHASWDEAHVGFWCEFSRDPDVFSAGFWRLLQAPYYMRTPVERMAPSHSENMGISDLIERYGASAERLLGRYGLYCGGCPHAPSETVRRAAERHGVAAANIERLLSELGMMLQADSGDALLTNVR